MADTTQTSAPATPKPPPITLEEKKVNLEILQYKDKSASSGFFKELPPEHHLNQIMAFCQGILGAKFICEAARNDQSSIFFMVSLAHDLDLKWTSIRNFYMTPNGKIGMEGNIMLSLLLSRGFKIKFTQSSTGEPEWAECWIKRPGGPDEFEMSIRYTYEQALDFGWPKSKDGIKMPWRDRLNMLRYRVLSACGRLVAADLFGGVYTLDEIEDFEPTTPYQKETRDDAADREAERNPGLKLEPKALDAVPSANVIEIPTKATKREPESALRPQEVRNEEFLSHQSEKSTEHAPKQSAPKPSPADPPNLKQMADDNAAKVGLTEEDLLPVSEPEPEPPKPIDPKVALGGRVKAFCVKYGGAPLTFTRFAGTFLGDKEKLKDLEAVGESLTVLENAFESLPAESLAKARTVYLENPEQMAKNIHVALSEIPPVATPDSVAPEEPKATTRKPRQAKPEPPPPPVEQERTNPLDDVLPEKWLGDTCDLALVIMQRLKMDQSNFLKMLKAFGTLELDADDADAFFQMYFHFPDTTVVLKHAKQRGISPKRVLDEFVEGMHLHAQLSPQTNTTVANKAIQNAWSEIQSIEAPK